MGVRQAFGEARRRVDHGRGSVGLGFSNSPLLRRNNSCRHLAFIASFSCLRHGILRIGQRGITLLGHVVSCTSGGYELGHQQAGSLIAEKSCC